MTISVQSPWPVQIASSQKLRDVRISPDGSMVLYQVQPFYKSDRFVSELWLAFTDVPQSARPLTNGLFYDRAGVFHPNGKQVVFLSDRHSPGRAAHIYVLGLTGGAAVQSEPAPLLSSPGTKAVLAFEISPDSRFLAFSSDDETSPEEIRKVEEKDDARVFGGRDGTTQRFARLRVYSFEKGTVSTLGGIRKDRHIESFTWSPDSKRILYRLRDGRGSEFTEREVILESVSIKNTDDPSCALGSYPRSPSGQNIWIPSGRIISLQSYEPRNPLDARALFVQHIDEAASSLNGTERMYGLSEDAVRVVNIAGTCHRHGGVAVEVCSGVETSIDVISYEKNHNLMRFTLFRTHQEAIWFGAWDARRVVDEDGNISYIFAAVLSSGVTHRPPNVYTGRVTGKGREVTETLQLSSHLQWLADAPVVATEVFQWTTRDGTVLSGVVRYPPGYDASQGRLPTVLCIHGGPYRRDILGDVPVHALDQRAKRRSIDYMPYFCNWREFLALEGYLVISPNYRGSQGRGHDFAHAASQGIGAYDWPDCESMVDEVIRRGLADPARLGVAGWSHGGSLTAWGVTKTKDRFKAAIVGAGASNWEGMVMESGSPELETEIGQSAPWGCDGLERSTRKTSPIHCVAGVATAVLILHGERDERVPVGQAIGLYRGLKRRASERGKQSAQLVIYPREPHGFVERKHAEDVLMRVLSHLDTWL
ncbi:putative peptidase YuxL [Hypsizygus marmoreus]|uniref:Dipeptidyl-peptidase V n=1 Tax=Hypsizygus marmoreus TaxID=39966 RepID=A0A369KAK6_HYPMA|nr:putative peptidase YuxL [Hypsizygus marmoreus]